MVDNPPIADSFPGKVVLKAAPQYFCQRWGLLITLVQEGRRQAGALVRTEGRRKKGYTVSLVAFFNWIVISATLH